LNCRTSSTDNTLSIKPVIPALLTALANPVAGLYTLVASTLLRQPLQDANTQELLVEGSWQAPRVSKIDRRTGKPLP
jgi:uncharacterized protein YhdP